MTSMPLTPSLDCQLCPRLCEARQKNKDLYPTFHNAPVMPFGDDDPRLLIVGLAPGLMGANQTGRPFTNDYAGVLLYETLIKFGWAKGNYGAKVDDGLILTGCRITNAVKCWPPENKPTTQEINICNQFLENEIRFHSQNPIIILALGQIAHNAVLKTTKAKKSAHPFKHGQIYELNFEDNKIQLVNSYHCSRYNTNTGVLTTQMFEEVFEKIQTLISNESV